MSLQTLLVDYPNYPARRVRRLATQLAFVEQATKHVDDPSVGSGIASDLMKFNLNRAALEDQLNDDVRKPAPAEPLDQEVTTRICVTPLAAGIKVINEMLEWMRVNTDANMKKDELDALVNRCRGIINGQAFNTDKTVIQARMSPQSDLPLETEAERMARGSLT